MSDEEEYESSQPGDDDDGEVSQETNDEGERVVCYYGFGFGLVLQSDCVVSNLHIATQQFLQVQY